MVKLKVEVDDWDTGESKEITLPCDLRREIDTSHELQIIDWEGDFALGYYNDINALNEVLDDINAENPTMNLQMLIAILDASGECSLEDKDFRRKICSSDYMVEEISDVGNRKLKTDGEKCSWYLATEMMIPFAKNITESKLIDIKKNSANVNWKIVWGYYEQMGFKVLTIGKKIYAFHWGDAE